MLWKDLRKFNIAEVVLEINRRLEDFRSLNKVADTLETSESTIRKYITSKGYKRVGNEFVPKDDICNAIEHTDEIEQNTPCNTDVINMPEIKENLMYISNEIDTLKSLINWFKDRDDTSNTDVIELANKIQLTLPSAPIKRTTIRINQRVWDMFDELVQENKLIDKHDLMSMAILEFVSRYKKDNECMCDLDMTGMECGEIKLEDNFNFEDFINM